MAGVVTAYVAVGSSLGDREGAIRAGIARVGAQPGVTVRAMSRLIETTAVGATGPPFLNGAFQADTTLSARALLELLLATETALGRVRARRWEPRILDLDLLLYGDYVIDEADLRVPHPRLAERLFVLGPLAEIAPAVVVPGAGQTVARLLARAKSA
ncbi:MAG: 2-amino-4-hydroxy-6-hydroxymethyldihydropteridine diphosphokinase [Planctomycetes bacterium]|nr:2-amino-4-hydroxy-6-hydroxymethyldihydropteridine diphosphokinase [Planctomycetota bacterium]